MVHSKDGEGYVCTYTGTYWHLFMHLQKFSVYSMKYFLNIVEGDLQV